MNNTTLKGLILSLYKSINWHHKKQWTELSYWIFFAGEGAPKKNIFSFGRGPKTFSKSPRISLRIFCRTSTKI